MNRPRFPVIARKLHLSVLVVLVAIGSGLTFVGVLQTVHDLVVTHSAFQEYRHALLELVARDAALKSAIKQKGYDPDKVTPEIIHELDARGWDVSTLKPRDMLSRLSDQDLDALQKNDLSKVSTDGLKILTGALSGEKHWTTSSGDRYIVVGLWTARVDSMDAANNHYPVLAAFSLGWLGLGSFLLAGLWWALRVWVQWLLN